MSRLTVEGSGFTRSGFGAEWRTRCHPISGPVAYAWNNGAETMGKHHVQRPERRPASLARFEVCECAMYRIAEAALSEVACIIPLDLVSA